MIDMQDILAAARRLAAAASSPSRVILFGSHARGTATEDSDLDLMVIEKELPDTAAEYLRLRGALGRIAPGVGVDLLLYPLAEFERRSQVPGTVLHEACVDGKVLHDALHCRSKAQERLAARLLVAWSLHGAGRISRCSTAE